MSYTMPYEISVGKFLYLNSILDADTQEELVNFLKDQSGAFSWEYTDMWGIHPQHMHSSYLYPWFSDTY